MKPTQFKYPDDNVFDAVAKKLRIKSIDNLELIMKTQRKWLKQKNSSKQNVSSSERGDMKDDQNEIIVDTDDFEQDDDNSTNLSSSKVRRKEFWELENKMQRARTDNLLKILYNFLEDEGNSLTVMEVLGYLLLEWIIKPI